MTENPLISVVIPTYGRNEALHKTIECVRQQSYSNWEVLVVDDNPHDSGQREKNQTFIASLNEPDKFYYFAHPDNQGACAARNTGVLQANGEVIAFYDDDDVWFEDKLERQLGFMKQHELDFTFCWMNEHYNGFRKVVEFVGEPDLYQSLLRKGDGICTSAIMVKTEVALAIPFDSGLASFQDFDYLLSLAKSFNGKVQPEILMDYQISPQGISRNPAKKVQGLAAIIEKFGNEYRKIGYLQGLAELHQKQADFTLLQGHYGKALKSYFTSLKIAPGNIKTWVKLVCAAASGKSILSKVIMRKQAMQWQKCTAENATSIESE